MTQKRNRTPFQVTMDPAVLKDLRKHCLNHGLTQSGYIEELVLADLKKEKKS